MPAQQVPATIHRISIDGVSAQAGDIYAVRIVADVNGQAYSYPSRTVWADVGPGMAKEDFPLAPASEYRVHFQVYLRDSIGQISLLQSQALQLAPSGIDLQYDLFRVDAEFARVVQPTLSVKYHIQ
jgi:hypothetical protein